MFETRWRNLKGLKLRLWLFLTYHGFFPEAIHFGKMSHTQRVTSMWATAICPLMGKTAPILCFHSRGQHLCKLIGTKESVYIRKEFNSHRTGLGHKHGRRFIVLGHKYGRHDVMWKHTIVIKTSLPLCLSFVSECTPSCSFPNVTLKFYCRHFQ